MIIFLYYYPFPICNPRTKFKLFQRKRARYYMIHRVIHFVVSCFHCLCFTKTKAWKTHAKSTTFGSFILHSLLTVFGYCFTFGEASLMPFFMFQFHRMLATWQWHVHPLKILILLTMHVFVQPHVGLFHHCYKGKKFVCFRLPSNWFRVVVFLTVLETWRVLELCIYIKRTCLLIEKVA